MIRTRVGYAGGVAPSPTYRAMGDHTEALQVDFDPRVLSYADLVAHIFASHDPTRDRGSRQYRAAVWTHDDEQALVARETGEAAARARGGALVTAIEPLPFFTRAEDYHQKYSLRRVRAVEQALVARFGSDRAMVDSTVAARVNGLLRGFGDPAILPSLELGDRALDALRARL